MGETSEEDIELPATRLIVQLNNCTYRVGSSNTLSCAFQGEMMILFQKYCLQRHRNVMGKYGSCPTYRRIGRANYTFCPANISQLHVVNRRCSCHQMAYFEAKMHQIRFRLGLCPRPCCGGLQCSRE